MELSKIKHMVRENGDKIIFMEHGEPELVMMSFVEYEKLARLHLPEAREHKTSDRHAKAQTTARANEQLPKEVEDDSMHETEFLAPVETAQVRAASLNGYDRIGELVREESKRAADIRLEDLPI